MSDMTSRYRRIFFPSCQLFVSDRECWACRSKLVKNSSHCSDPLSYNWSQQLPLVRTSFLFLSKEWSRSNFKVFKFDLELLLPTFLSSLDLLVLLVLDTVLVHTSLVCSTSPLFRRKILYNCFGIRNMPSSFAGKHQTLSVLQTNMLLNQFQLEPDKSYFLNGA